MLVGRVEAIRAAERAGVSVWWLGMFVSQKNEQNEEVLTSPEKVNEDPFGSGWLIKVKLTNESELTELMDSDTYTNLTS